jgi:DNA-binding CsgD family transcriptional regulator/tetratricopeptide (TPR) repeat protein
LLAITGVKADDLPMSVIGRRLASQAQLLERADELAALNGALSEARSGVGRLVFVTGEAGIGKTSLVRVFTASAGDSQRVLEGACDPLFTPRPLGPFADIASQTNGSLGGLLDGTAGSREVFEAVRDELASARTILVLEDLHWADEATLDVLRTLGRRIEATSSLVLCTYRDDELGRTHPLRTVVGELGPLPGIESVRLEPLSAGAVAELSAGSNLDADELYRRTSGNPFYVRELLEAGAVDVSGTIRDVVLGRTARLSQAAADVVETVAIAPPMVHIELLERTCGDSVAGLDDCITAGVLQATDGSVSFRHELARIAIEETLSPNRRLDLHRRFLAALADPRDTRDFTRLAHHAEAAADKEAVLRYAPAAAEEAHAAGAYREAAAQYARALRFADSMTAGERAEVLERQSDSYYLTDYQVAAIDALRQAIDLYRSAGDTSGEARALSGLVTHLACRGFLTEAEDAAAEAIAILEGRPDGAVLAEASNAMALLSAYRGDAAAVDAWGGQAVELATRSGDVETRIDALITRTTVELFGDAGADEGLDRTLTLARQHGAPNLVARAMHNLAFGALVHDSHEASAQWLDAGLAYCDEHELDLWRLALLSLRVRFELDEGRWTDAAATAQVIVAETRDSPEPGLRARLVLALVRARRGDPDTSSQLAEATVIARAATDPGWSAALACVVAEVAWLEQRTNGVADATQSSLERELASRSSWWAGELAYWRHKNGIVDELPADLGGPWALQLAGDWRAAASAWETGGRPYERALALSESGDAPSLRLALELCRDLGARPLEAVVARRLRELGASVPRGPRPTTRSNPANLTVRELEVLQLIAEGLRNAEIAERLVVSQRTIDHHVSAILRKLSAKTRGEAVAAARRAGLIQDR